jgi:hypothetical protein
MFVAADLESLGQVRFQAVSIPNPLHGHAADTLSLSHAPHARIGWCRMQRGFHDGFDFFLGKARNTTPAVVHPCATLPDEEPENGLSTVARSVAKIPNACAISIRPLCLKTRPFWTLAAAFFF